VDEIHPIPVRIGRIGAESIRATTPFSAPQVHYIVMPMSQDAFVKLNKKESQAILKEVNPAVEGGKFNPDTVTILAQDLSFYPEYRFLDVADFSTMPAFQRFVVVGCDKCTVLNGTNEPIYELNKKIPVKLNKDNVIEYVRFFFNQVRGRSGRFTIIESIDDIAWREEPAPAVRKAIGQLLEPLELLGADAKGFRVEARMLSKSALYRVRINIGSDGQIGMPEDMELLIEDMPVFDDTLGQ